MNAQPAISLSFLSIFAVLTIIVGGLWMMKRVILGTPKNPRYRLGFKDVLGFFVFCLVGAIGMVLFVTLSHQSNYESQIQQQLRAVQKEVMRREMHMAQAAQSEAQNSQNEQPIIARNAPLNEEIDHVELLSQNAAVIREYQNQHEADEEPWTEFLHREFFSQVDAENGGFTLIGGIWRDIIHIVLALSFVTLWQAWSRNTP